MSLFLVDEENPILTQPCPVYNFPSTVDLDKLFYNMGRLMIEHSGIGLAAPQVGLPYRLFIHGCDTPTMIINPEVIAEHGEPSRCKEGCLSLPGLFVHVKRYTSIDVRYQNIKGEIVEERLDGMSGRCFNHETDHVNGILITDRAAKLSLKMAMAKRALTKREK